MKMTLLTGAVLAVLSSAANAADLPRAATKTPTGSVPYAQTYFSWTGGHVGLAAGYGANASFNFTPVGGTALPTGLDPKGGFYGANIGYDYQFAPNWVIGIEGDAFLSDISDGKTFASFGPLAVGASSKLDKFGTARGKLGYAIDRVLLYGTGGLAVGYNEATLDASALGTTVGLFDSKTHVGWAAGAGVDWAFLPNFAWKTEYLYIDFGGKNYSFAGNVAELHPSLHTVKTGIDFKFSPN